jgi:hypothetical protein
LQQTVATVPKARLAETLQWIDYKAREHKMMAHKQRAVSNASSRMQEIQVGKA